MRVWCSVQFIFRIKCELSVNVWKHETQLHRIINYLLFFFCTLSCKFSYFIASHDAVHSIKRYLILLNKSSLVLAWVSVEYSGARANCVCIVLLCYTWLAVRYKAVWSWTHWVPDGISKIVISHLYRWIRQKHKLTTF